jgi:hypothetical protein
MSESNEGPRTKAPSAEQCEELQRRLAEAEQTLEAIRHGEVDALVVAGPQGEQVFSLSGAEPSTMPPCRQWPPRSTTCSKTRSRNLAACPTS